jgi:hypothetical protein
MGFLRTAAKLGIANKLVSEARKPQNQAKAKELFNNFTSKNGGKGKATPARSRRRSA